MTTRLLRLLWCAPAACLLGGCVSITASSAGARGMAVLEKTNRLEIESLDDRKLEDSFWGRWEIGKGHHILKVTRTTASSGQGWLKIDIQRSELSFEAQAGHHYLADYGPSSAPVRLLDQTTRECWFPSGGPIASCDWLKTAP